MNIKLSKLYMIVFVTAMITIGILSVITDSVFNSYTIFVCLFILAFTQLIAITIFENRLSFMDFSNIPQKKKEEPVEDSTRLATYIYGGLKSGIDLNTIKDTLLKSGYREEFISYVLNMMIDNGVIKIATASNTIKVEEPAKEIKTKVEEPAKEIKTKKMIKKKNDKARNKSRETD